MVGTLLAVLLLAAAATIALVPLPAPAAGGTCGPSSGSESAIAAFFDPISIGAGPEPSVASGGRPQWQAFVDECQASTNSRIIQSGVIVVGALLAGLALPWAVRRFSRKEHPDQEALPPPGWYPDPADPNVPRWWDERGWGSRYAPPDHEVPAPTS